VLEATTRACPHCDGIGLVRTASSAGLSALRLIEDEAAKGRGTLITLYASTEAAIYLLNAKRADLAEIEHRYGVHVEVMPEGEDEGAKMRVTSSQSLRLYRASAGLSSANMRSISAMRW
jgi:ribonuclease E